MIQGTADEIVPVDAVEHLAKKLSNQKGIHVTFDKIEGADHFYTGKLSLLLNKISEYLDKRLEA
jgi:alpha/beta superfamily hydrolase